MASSEGCSPYALSVGVLIGIFVGREDISGSEQAVEAVADQPGWNGASLQQQQRQHEKGKPLGPPPSPFQYRVLSTVIADQLQAIARAEHKPLGELQDRIRRAFQHSEFGRSVAERLGRRLSAVRSLDDLLDLAAGLNLLLIKPEGGETWTGHGRDRPMYLRANSVFGVFVRRLKSAIDGASFSRLSSIYEEVVRYSASARDMEAESPSDLSVEMELAEDLSMDLGTIPASGNECLGGTGVAGEGWGGGHIGAYLRRQASPGGGRGAGCEEKEPDDGGRGGAGGLFHREVSAWQLQLHLQRKVLRLENGLSSEVPFEEIEGEVQAALGSRSDVPRAHFLRLMNCMHHRELQGALDSLHRYFDYAVRRGGPSMSNAEGFLDLARGGAGGSGRHTPQHAALALARLHFEFGHLKLASLALGEAIRVAQQSGDKVCIAQAMGWLHQVLAAQGHPRAGDVLRRCAAQAADLQLHQLMNTATLLLAKEAAVAKHGYPVHVGGGGGGSSGASSTAGGGGGGAGGARKRTSPTRVWECLTAIASGDLRGLLQSEANSAEVGLLESMAAAAAAAAGGGGGRPAVELRGGTGGEVAAELSCQRLLVEAGAFERFGYSDMAVACARSVLQVYGDLATASDVEIASACAMNAVLRGKRFPGLPPPPPSPAPQQQQQQQSRDGGSAVEATEEGTRGKAVGQEGGEEQGTDENGGEGERGPADGKDEGGCVFEVSLSVALRQHEAFPHPVSNVWAAGVMVLLHEWMVNRGEFRAAEGLGMSLRGCCPLGRGAEAFIEAHLQRVRLLRAQCRWREAVEAASELLRLSDTRGLAPQYARLLLELSRARLGAEPASPVGALPHALRCLAVCESYSLDAVHASAMVHLAQVHLRMGSTRRARILLRACLGQLLANAPVQDQGEAWLEMAKCDIAEVSLSYPSPSSADGTSDARSRPGAMNASEDETRAEEEKEKTEARMAARARRAAALGRAAIHLDRAIAMLKRCHGFTGLKECFYLKARVCGEMVRGAGGDSETAEARVAERDAAAENFLAVSEARARALASPSPGLKIGPAEVKRYIEASMRSVPWG